MKILLAEDEQTLAGIVIDSLREEGYDVIHAPDGQIALEAFFKEEPSAVILDVMMPRLDGYQVAKKIRQADNKTPILFLTAKSQAKDAVQGFESGGNDFLRKPFGMQELLIRLQLLLNDTRLWKQEDDFPDPFLLGDVLFSHRQQNLLLEEKMVTLTTREADLLKMLCAHAPDTVSKQSILLQIWEDDTFINSRSLDVYISKLRGHLKPAPDIKIQNVRGIGYKLMLP
ncbi:MAG: response regulator transcription factor [Bacteroidota bacterium]